MGRTVKHYLEVKEIWGIKKSDYPKDKLCESVDWWFHDPLDREIRIKVKKNNDKFTLQAEFKYPQGLWQSFLGYSQEDTLR